MRLTIKILVLIIGLTTLVGGLIHPVQMELSLSWQGITHWHAWELVTYPFVEMGRLSISWLLQLALNLYLTWVCGSLLMERFGVIRFLSLYFGATLFAAMASLAPLAWTHSTLAGASAPLFALLISWIMLNEGARLFLFSAFPIRADRLIIALIAFTLFVEVSNLNWVSVTGLAASALFGYFFTLLVWRKKSPFAFLHPFEKRFLQVFEKRTRPQGGPKIYDIHSGAPVLDDDQFMDAMLEKISRQGPNSLTADEKKRMENISSKKKP